MNAYVNIESRKVIMPDQDKINNTTQDDIKPVVPLGSADVPAADDSSQANEVASSNSDEAMQKIIDKISEVHNILIALSSDPSVDEMCAAIGLSIYLDRIGKRATSIYSGATPNALQFLKPEQTFQNTADVLRDFVIALSKEKADHLRYKLDGDFVKIFITPYKTKIDEEDFEFSYGDFNIEFVLSLNVANGIDLDDALREHGRVMHDATVANMTTGNPGKFGDIEWSDKRISSISEMSAKLLYSIGGKEAVTGEEATAFLTGIVSATDHFSNAKTTAVTLRVASELMKSGADRQLISENIPLESENMFLLSSTSNNTKKETKKEHSDSLTIDHDEDSEENNRDKESDLKETDKPEKEEEKTEGDDLLADLQAAAANLAAGDVTIPNTDNQPLHIDSAGSLSSATDSNKPDLGPTPSSSSESTTPELNIPTTIPEPSPTEPSDSISGGIKETVLTPSADFLSGDLNEGTSKYGQMLEDALSESNSTASIPDLSAPATPAIGISNVPTPDVLVSPEPSAITNPVLSVAPTAPVEPEINGVPEISYAPTTSSSDELLPPPPMPPIDFSSNMMPPTPDASNSSPIIMPTPDFGQNTTTPDAFKIPGGNS